MAFRILIADDESLIRTDLRELLEELGYVVEGEAKDGLEALELLDRKNPDVAILDIKMPGLDGIEVAKRISHKVPVIILTAYSEKDLIQRAGEAGVMSYLTKPFREGDIPPAVELAITHFIEKSALSERVSYLNEQLETRKIVEKAKGLLMTNEDLSEAEAYRRIQKMSMKKNKPMKEVAEAIVLMLE